jgi:hypothetical protein
VWGSFTKNFQEEKDSFWFTHTSKAHLLKKFCFDFKYLKSKKLAAKTYFSIQNPSIFSSPFILSPENFNPYTTAQSYQFHPIHHNSLNIQTQPLPSASNNNVIIDCNKVRNARIKSNLNNFCNYCLPTNTSHQTLQKHQQELLITGSKRVGLKSLFAGSEVNDCIESCSLTNQFKKSIMVSIFLILIYHRYE